MGRPRQFDEAEAIGAAAEVFRTRGYDATSVDDLVAATSMHRGSLYGVFGSKSGLFLRALDSVADPASDREGLLDLLLVALLELAPTDRRIRERAGRLMRENDVTPQQLGARLVARAGLPDEREQA